MVIPIILVAQINIIVEDVAVTRICKVNAVYRSIAANLIASYMNLRASQKIAANFHPERVARNRAVPGGFVILNPNVVGILKSDSRYLTCPGFEIRPGKQTVSYVNIRSAFNRDESPDG